MECKIKVKSLTNSTVLSEKEFWVNKYIEMIPSDTILPSSHWVNFQDHCSHVNSAKYLANLTVDTSENKF